MITSKNFNGRYAGGVLDVIGEVLKPFDRGLSSVQIRRPAQTERGKYNDRNRWHRNAVQREKTIYYR